MQQRAATCACKSVHENALPVHLSDRFINELFSATVFGIDFYIDFGVDFGFNFD